MRSVRVGWGAGCCYLYLSRMCDSCQPCLQGAYGAHHCFWGLPCGVHCFTLLQVQAPGAPAHNLCCWAGGVCSVQAAVPCQPAPVQELPSNSCCCCNHNQPIMSASPPAASVAAHAAWVSACAAGAAADTRAGAAGGDVRAAAQHSRSHEPAWKQFLIHSFLHARVSPHLIYFVQCQPFQGVLQQWHIH